MLTFVPWIRAGESTRKAKELQLSELRSLTARKVHRRRRLEELKQRQLEGTTRPIDWFFGNIGGSSRPLGHIDVAVLTYYLEHALRIAVGGNLLLKDKLSRLRHLMAPMAQNLIQHAMTELPLLNSLLAWATVLMAQDHPGNGTLVSAVYDYSHEAMLNLRLWISNTDVTSPAYTVLVSCVVFLCLAGFQAGDLVAAQVHLRFLVKLAESLDPAIPEHGRLLWEIGSCRLQYAVELGLPIVTSSGQAPVFPAARLKELTAPKTSWNKCLRGEISSIDIPKKRSDVGLSQCIASEILTSTILDVVLEFTTIMDRIYDLAQDSDAPLPLLLTAMGKSHECLHRTWMKWYDVQQRRCSHNKALQNVFFDPDTPECDLDEPALLAMQILLIVNTGSVLAPALPILSDRLRMTLSDEWYVLAIDTIRSRGIDRTMLDTLLIWICIAGMLGATQPSHTFDWFRKQGLNVSEDFKIENTTQMMAAVAPFIPRCMPLDDRFLLMANSLVKDLGTWRNDLV